MIEVKTLHVSRADSWEQNAGSLKGHITFSGPQGEVKIDLDEEFSRQVVKLCSEQIVNSVKSVADNMVAETLDQSIKEQFEENSTLQISGVL